MSDDKYSLSELAVETLVAEVGQPASVNLFTDPEAFCPCVADHNPNVIVFNRHHVVPLAWGGPDEEWNVRLLCPTGHYSVHHLLRVARQVETPPNELDWWVRGSFGPNLRAIAQEGWDEWKRLQEEGLL